MFFLLVWLMKSHFAFGAEAHLNFYFAMVIIINAIILYNLPAARLLNLPTGDLLSSELLSRSPLSTNGISDREMLLRTPSAVAQEDYDEYGETFDVGPRSTFETEFAS